MVMVVVVVVVVVVMKIIMMATRTEGVVAVVVSGEEMEMDKNDDDDDNCGSGGCNGEIFKNPDLADTLEQLGKEGGKLFYTGQIANEIVETFHRQAEQLGPSPDDQGWFVEQGGSFGLQVCVLSKPFRSLISQHRAVWRRVVNTTYRGYQVRGDEDFERETGSKNVLSLLLSFHLLLVYLYLLSLPVFATCATPLLPDIWPQVLGMSPPSAGGVTMANALNVMEGFDVKNMAKKGVEMLHRMIDGMNMGKRS
eukprot:767391-Hanusia_phi.AAC.1